MRGPRVVERQQSACKETDWPFCSDEDWVSSGHLEREDPSLWCWKCAQADQLGHGE